MKIAFFVTEFPALSETFIANQIIALQNSGHEVHIYSQIKPSSSKLHQLITDAGLLNNTFYLDIPKTRLTKIIKLLLKSFLNPLNKNNRSLFHAVFKNESRLSVYNIIPFLDKPCYDVLHAHFGVNGNFVTQLRKLGLFKKSKFITTFHGYDLSEVYGKSNFYTELFSDCNQFTVNSLYSKRQLSKLGCNENKIFLLPTGLNTGFFKNDFGKKNESSEICLLFVGRLIKLKGPHLFIEICQLLQKRNSIKVVANIIGEGPMSSELLQLIEKYKLDHIVKLAGAQTQTEVMRYMNNSDIFILPGIIADGLAEAQGLVIQEAQAMELPVIVSDVGGMKEGLIDGMTGFVVHENDLDGFAEKIELLATTPLLRKQMGEAGRRFVKENYDIKKLNNNLLEFYQNKINVLVDSI